MRKAAMKRKNKKNEKPEENGVNDVRCSTASENDNTDQNSDIDSEEEYSELKKKRHNNKRNKVGKKILKENTEDQNEKSKSDTDKKKKSDKRKSSAGKKNDESDKEDESEGSKNKSDKKKRALSPDGESEEDSQYEVESILEEKYIKGIKHYLIRWKGYEPESDTWEPESTVNCKELIQKFIAEKGNSKSEKKKKEVKKGSIKKTKPKDDEIDWDENEQFEVDRILEVHFKKDGKREFLVSWKGYPQSQSSWEPEENMDCPDLIEKFMSKVEKAKEMDQRELRVARTPTSRFTLDPQANERRLSKRHNKKQRVHYYDAE